MSPPTSAPIVIESELQEQAERLYRILRERADADDDDEVVRLAFAVLAYAIGVRDGRRASRTGLS